MTFELFNYETEETEVFDNFMEFAYWFNYTDKKYDIRNISEVDV